MEKNLNEIIKHDSYKTVAFSGMNVAHPGLIDVCQEAEANCM